MAKIPFTLEAWLKDKSQRVETRDGRIVHNIWPVKEPLIVNGKRTEVCALIDGEEDALVFFEGGKYLSVNSENPFDLFIVTPKPTDTSEFEMKVSEFAEAYNLAATNYESEEYKTCNGNLHLIIDKYAAELLAIAREQFIKDSYVIEKKAFHDAVENISDKHRAEMSVQYSLHCKIEDGTRHAIMNWSEFQKVAQKFIDIGKEEALKDLPRWRKDFEFMGVREPEIVGPWLCYKKNRIVITDLEKLPGFKED